MSQSHTENTPIDLVAPKERRGMDSLVLMLLSSFLNEFFVWWSFAGRMTWESWPQIPNLSIFLALWWFGAHVLFLVWVAFSLFRSRLQVPLVVFGVLTIVAVMSGCAIQSEVFSRGVFTAIGPALFFLLSLIASTLLMRERRFDLGIQVLLSATMGLGAGLLYIYLYVSSI
jgi:hypothetical protein